MEKSPRTSPSANAPSLVPQLSAPEALAQKPPPSIAEARTALRSAIDECIPPGASQAQKSDLLNRFERALNGNELHLEFDPSGCCLTRKVWQAYEQLANANGKSVTSVFLARGEQRLPEGLQDLPGLSYVELKGYRAAILDCRGALPRDARDLALNLPDGHASTIHAPTGCTYAVPAATRTRSRWRSTIHSRKKRLASLPRQRGTSTVGTPRNS
ncbi:hypothetical protein J7E62_06625 [Variovorax paradoxus]|nr:hypothetical protein [Variovorax paradoxus]